MKPESVKSILAFYLSEKQPRLVYDDLDGVAEQTSKISGKAVTQGAGIDNVLEELYQDISPELEAYQGLVQGENQVRAREAGRRLSDIADNFEELRRRSPRTEGNSLQFPKQCIFVSPNCSQIEIPIVRSGDTDGTATVSWRTSDSTAEAGSHYIAATGIISFAEGEKEKNITIQLVENIPDTDVCFKVELLDPVNINLGNLNPVTVYISDHSNYYDDEKRTIENVISNNVPFSPVSNIAVCVLDKLTVNTLKVALQCVCSNAVTISEELALAFELVRQTGQSTCFETVANTVSTFFSHLPELEDLTQLSD